MLRFQNRVNYLRIPISLKSSHRFNHTFFNQSCGDQVNKFILSLCNLFAVSSYWHILLIVIAHVAHY